MKYLFAIMTTLLVMSCKTNYPPHPAEITDQDICPAACQKLRSLQCPEGDPIDMHAFCNKDSDCVENGKCSPKGTCTQTCEQFCVHTENSGVWLRPACVASITKCSQLNACTTGSSFIP